MKNMIKPYSFLLYLLSFLLFIVAGTAISGWVGAADGQGLAGGAIVLFYGIITGLAALVAALFIARYAPRKVIIWLNVIFAVALGLLFVFFSMRYKEKHKSDPPPHEPREMKPTAPVAEPTGFNSGSTSIHGYFSMGMGFFLPNFLRASSILLQSTTEF